MTCPTAPQLDVDAELAEVAGVLNAQHARLSRVMAQALATGSWEGDRIHSPAQWLAWKAGLSPHRAKEIVRIAERRAEFPVVCAAFDRGELAVDQVVAVMRAPAWADELVLDFAKVATVHQLRRAIQTEYFEHDPDDPPPQPAPDPRDRLSTWVTENNRWRISGELDLDRGAIVDAALAETLDALHEQGDERPTMGDALVEMSHRSLDAVPSRSRRDHFRTWIHLDADTADATLTAGWKLPETVRDFVLCDGRVQAVWEREGLPFNVGRMQRIVPERTRRIVERRDQGCRVPGCTAHRYVEIHHIIHWLRGGTTDTWNLLSLCLRHHRMHHMGQLGIAGNADDEQGVVFTDWMGRALGPNGQPVLPTGPPPKPARGYRHPCGERMDYQWVGLGWIHPNVIRRRRQRA